MRRAATNENDPDPKARWSGITSQPLSEKKIDHHGKEQNGDEPSAPGEIKTITREEEKRLPHSRRSNLYKHGHADEEYDQVGSALEQQSPSRDRQA